MPQQPIDDAYIDSIIKSNSPFDPALNVTQGIKLRELMKRFRDYYDQQIPIRLSQLVNDKEYLTASSLENLWHKEDIIPFASIKDLNEKLGAKADLVEGKIPVSQLPGFVDDVLEYPNREEFPVSGEQSKIYIAVDTNKTYRWGGENYVIIGADLSLGETVATAYRGDRGKTAYDHSQATGNPHSTTKADLGLSKVNNTSDEEKPVSTAQATALSIKLTGTLATDSEAQLEASVSEDNKVISRLKLFNWWNWIRTQALTLSNKLTLVTGTTAMPPLIMPAGSLTAVAQNGAVERDQNGKLWTVREGKRYRLVEDDGTIIPVIVNLALKGNNVPKTVNINIFQEKIAGSITTGLITNSIVAKITAINQIYSVYGTGSIEPVKKRISYFLRIKNGTWRTDTYGKSTAFTDKLIGEMEIMANNSDTVAIFSKIITGVGNSDSDGAVCGIDIDGTRHNLRAMDNSKNLLVKDAEFQIIEKISYEYNDPTNANGLNKGLRTESDLKTLFIERIKS